MSDAHTDLGASAPAWIDAPALRRLLSMGAAIDALDEALQADEALSAPERTHIDVGDGQLLLMPAASGGSAGVKIITMAPENPDRGLPLVQGLYALFAAGTLSPAAVIDGAELTRLRTPAVSALATRYLAREDARRLVVFGAGVQAAAHVTAMRAVRPITEVVIVGLSGESADALAGTLASEGLAASRGDAASVADADIVCTCTTAGEPLFDGTLLRPGAHVNAMGSYQPHTRELDVTTLNRARVVVEDRAAVLAEAGDLIIPAAEGAWSPDAIVADLREVVEGVRVRRSPDDITVFKSVGVAWEDLVVARAAAARLAAS